MKNTYVVPLLSLTACVSVSQEVEAKKQTQPNVVLIMVDDMGYGDFGCFGNKRNKTPNIDFLAQNGAKLTDFHTNGAVSSPTRAALMTGRYQQFFGVEGVLAAAGDRNKGLDPNAVTIARLLKGNGYATAIYGKWHLGYGKEHNPIHYGFDEFKGYIAGNVDYFSHVDLAGYLDWWHNDEICNEQGYTTFLLTDYAVDYISRPHDKPFFLYLPFEVAHTPLQAPDDKAYRIEGKKMGNPPAREDMPRNKVYKAMTEALDDCVGRIIAKLQEQKIADNTLILFFSDNGGSGAACNEPLAGHKGSMLEGGHRVSFVAYLPEVIKPATVINETILTMDILPTLCELSQTELKGEFDGVSFWKTLTQGEKLADRTVFWRMNGRGAARYKNWKLFINTETREIELYDLDQDIKEKNNIIDKHRDLALAMLDDFTRWEASHSHVPKLTRYKSNDKNKKKK